MYSTTIILLTKESELVSFAAVFQDVTQRSPERNGGALRDIPKDSRGGD